MLLVSNDYLEKLAWKKPEAIPTGLQRERSVAWQGYLASMYIGVKPSIHLRGICHHTSQHQREKVFNFRQCDLLFLFQCLVVQGGYEKDQIWLPAF